MMRYFDILKGKKCYLCRFVEIDCMCVVVLLPGRRTAGCSLRPWCRQLLFSSKCVSTSSVWLCTASLTCIQVNSSTISSMTLFPQSVQHSSLVLYKTLLSWCTFPDTEYLKHSGSDSVRACVCACVCGILKNAGCKLLSFFLVDLFAHQIQFVKIILIFLITSVLCSLAKYR